MHILIATSEANPFAKTGGLADVCGALPIALKRLGHEVTLVLPAFRQVHQASQFIGPTSLTFDIPIGSKIVRGRLLKSRLLEEDVPVYLVEQNDYYDRPQLYREDGEDYKDNCERFVFFSRAVMEAIRLLRLPVDVLHVNDWQTSLIPALLKIEYARTRGYEDIVSLLTIHNLAYQGSFWHWDMLLTGLDWRYFNWRQMEFYGNLNLLKTGVVFADSINTVSPRYAEEIQQSPLGCGLEGVLQQRSDSLSGIINGVDYSQWDPARDRRLTTNYSVDDWRSGKAASKRALQEELGLSVQTDQPLFGFVGRLAEQKGCDLLAEVMQRWLPADGAQWVILGDGEPQYRELLSKLAQNWPGKVALRLGFSDDLAHRIEAGADMFLMPSRYEPCGLNQLYSLKYGAVPVVRETGGLADTIIDAGAENLAAGLANGFSFSNYDAAGLQTALSRACHLYRNEPDEWAKVVERGMLQDWSWTKSAGEYARLYERTIERVKQNQPNTRL